MTTPGLVVAAALVEPCWAGPILVQPHTLRRHMQLEAARSPLLDGRPCTELADIVQAVSIFDTRWPRLDLQKFIRTVRPVEVPAVLAAIEVSIIQGWKTCLAMREPPMPGERQSRPGRDRFGTVTRLWAYAVKILHLSPDAALDLPLCQLNVLAATSEAISGKVPIDEDYFEMSSVPPREIVGVNHGPDPQPDGGQDERSSNNDGQPQEQPTGNVAVPHLPKSGEKEIHGGRHTL